MKQNYIRSGALFFILVLAVFSVICFVFTKNRIDRFNLEAEFRTNVVTSFIDYHDENTDGHLEQAVVENWNYYFNLNPTEDTGFYSSLIELRTGRVIIESSALEFDNDNTDASLNAKARMASDEYTKDYTVSKHPGGFRKTDKGIFITTSKHVLNTGNGSLIITNFATFKPLSAVLKENAATYITGLTIFLLTEAAVLISFINLYRSQKNFEIRNQKLTRGIAHELKTPLAVTKATVENWDYLDNDMRREHSKNVISEVDHMSDMVDKLLEVSRIDGGNVKLNRESVDLLSVTRRMTERNIELLRERNISFSFTASENAYPVYADPDMMDIVIGNFMSNAIKYCDHEIAVSFEKTGKKITFSITNDGAKIEKKDLDKVWDIFYTTDNARTNRISNSGVGLSVVKSILDAHKSKYGCTSGAEGTAFWFSMDRSEPSK